ncbi:radiation-inducible immediate-early gene IEX-1 [Arapaima gigas]
MELKNIPKMTIYCPESIPAHWERIPVRHLDTSLSPIRPRSRRTLKVLYPPLAKRPFPRREPSPAKRWLLALTAVLFLQVYTEEGLEGPQIYPEEGWELLPEPQNPPELGLSLPNGHQLLTGTRLEESEVRGSCWVSTNSDVSHVQWLPFQAVGPCGWNPSKNNNESVNSLLHAEGKSFTRSGRGLGTTPPTRNEYKAVSRTFNRTQHLEASRSSSTKGTGQKKTRKPDQQTTAMFARSNSMVLSYASDSLYARHLTFNQLPRNSEPEIFTFEAAPATQSQRSSQRHRRRNPRILYPSKVRKYLPPAEKSPVKRWLLILCLVVCLQIYTEEAYTETPVADAPAEDVSLKQYQVLPFRSAEQHAQHLKGASSADTQREEPAEHAEREEHESPATPALNRTCPGDEDAEGTEGHEQSKGSCYVMALLYPVYHRLGSEQ